MLCSVKKLLALYRIRRKDRLAGEKRRQEVQRLRGELEECRRQLRALESWYDLAADPHTVDSCIFQQCALQARYDGLLRQARQYLGVSECPSSGSVQAKSRIHCGKAAKTAELSVRVPQ